MKHRKSPTLRQKIWWPQRDSNPRLGLERASPWVVISGSTPGACAFHLLVPLDVDRERVSPRRDLLGQILPRHLGDLLEVVALDHIQEDHGRGVVALGVPGDGPRVGNTLKGRCPQGRSDLAPSGYATLPARR